MLSYVLLAAAGSIAALIATSRTAAFARRIGAVAVADPRGSHQGHVPTLGGVAVLIALLGALALVDTISGGAVHGDATAWSLLGLFTAVLTILACGVADDLRALGVLPKLVCQLVAGALILGAGYGISGLTSPFTGNVVALGWLGIPLTLLWIVGITNAFNLIDGLDGLAAGIALIASLAIATIAAGNGRFEAAAIAAALAGCLAAFLRFNFHPAKIFLGDSGALLLGFLLALPSIHAVPGGPSAVDVVPLLLLFIVPIAETGLTIARRLLGAVEVVPVERSVEPEFRRYRFRLSRAPAVLQGDRDHVHHRLLALGLAQPRAVLLLYAVGGVFALLAVTSVHARGATLVLLLALPLIASWWALRELGYAEISLLRRGLFLPLVDLTPVDLRSLRGLLEDLASFPQSRQGVRPLVVYGNGAADLSALRAVATQPGSPFQLVAFLDDHASLWGTDIDGFTVIGGPSSLEGIFERFGPCDVVVAASLADERLRHVQELCRRHRTVVHHGGLQPLPVIGTARARRAVA